MSNIAKRELLHIYKRPSLPLKLMGSLSRSLPDFRGRSRARLMIHRLFENKGFVDIAELGGFSMVLHLDDFIARNIYIDGVFDAVSTAAMSRIIRPASVIFDVGANIGYYTLLLALQNGPDGVVFAVEPVPRTRGVLLQNLQLNPELASRTTIVESAVSSFNGTVLINVSSGRNSGASHVVTQIASSDQGRADAGIDETISVKCERGDEIWRRAGCPDVSLVKIDIEGHEYSALVGMAEMLTTNRDVAVMVEVHSDFLLAAGSSISELFGYLFDLGFCSFDYDLESAVFVRNDQPRKGELVIFSRKQLG